MSLNKQLQYAKGYLLGAFLIAQLAQPTIGAETRPHNAVKWRQIAPHLDFAHEQTWVPAAPSKTKKFKFSAIRFHLGYFAMRLLAISQYQESLANAQHVSPNLADLGLKAVHSADLFGRRVAALAPAGFPASEQKPINLGLLKIDGALKSELAKEGPSAVLCLDSPIYANESYQYQLPTFYRTNQSGQRHLINKCKDAVQVGPRILEHPNSDSDTSRSKELFTRTNANGLTESIPVYPGIPDSSANLSAYYRTVFAVDDPDRNYPAKKSRENARNGYLIVTESSATLWDLQDMLKSSEFYPSNRFAPWWALNLVGGDYAGLVVQDNEKTVLIGNTDITQASVLAIVPHD